MFKSIAALLATALFSLSVTAAEGNSTAQNIGYSGTLSSLDGGLGGIVSVVDANTLLISSYKLKSASAPALYWWGTTDGVLKNGFRISSAQVTDAAKSDTLEIKLDLGKTSADFSTVGLWCERFSVSFGQATLMAASGATGTSAPAATMTGSGAAATSAKSGAGSTSASYGAAFGVLIAAGIFVELMI